MSGIEGGSATVIGEAGRVEIGQDHAAEWHRVEFGRAIENAVVVLMVNTANGSDPVTVRARAVDATGFSFQLDEWDYLDGAHAVESVSWLAVSEGVHTLDDGSVIVAERVAATDAFRSYDYDRPFEAAPVVLAQTVTTNDASAVTTRIDDVTATGFRLKLQGEEADRAHADETVAVIAIAPGADLVAGDTGDTVRHGQTTIDFGETVEDAVFLAQMQSHDGGDTSTVRGVSLGATGATVFVEEEQSADGETGHTTETVGYLALSAGELLAALSDPLGAAPAPAAPAALDAGPIAEDNAYETAEDGAISANILTDPDPATGLADRDPDGDPIRLVGLAVDGRAVAPGEAFALTLEGGGKAIGGTATVDLFGNLLFQPDGAAALELDAGDRVSATFSYTIETPVTGPTRVIDFEGLAGGAWLEGATLPGVAAIRAVRAQDMDEAAPPNAARLYDSRQFGRDDDLMAAVSGELSNVLMIQESLSDGAAPDDNARGGTMRIEFDGPSTLYSVDLIDIEEKNGERPRWTIEYADGRVESVAAITTADREAKTQSFGPEGRAGVVALELELVGSGAIDNIVVGQPQTATAEVVLAVTGAGEGQPPAVTLGAADDAYAIHEDETLAGADLVAGDALARRIGELAVSGGVADGADPAGLTVTGFRIAEGADPGGFAASLDGAASLGEAVGVTLTDGATAHRGLLTLAADGAMRFEPTDFAGLAEGEARSFALVYEITDGTSTAEATATITVVGKAAPPTGTISGLAFEDADGDGLRADAEALKPGIAVTLLDAGGATVAATTTDAAGAYAFDLLPGGTYTVVFAGAPAREFTARDAGDDARDSDVDAAGRATVEIAEGGAATVDAGYTAGAIAGRAFFDADADGLRGDAEGGVSGLRVALLDAAGATVAETVTDAGGAYAFADVLAGEYRVAVLDRAGFAFTAKDAGDDARDSDVDAAGLTDPIALGLGQRLSDIDAGLVGGTISGTVFEDLSGAVGLFDGEDRVLEGATVRLLDATGAVVETAVTDAAGVYAFDALAAGDYTVEVVNPVAGSEFTAQDAGGPEDESRDSDVGADGRAGVSLAPGGAAEIDAGVARGFLGDLVFLDENGNGVRDLRADGTLEAGVAGVLVSLYRVEGATETLVATDVTGDGAAAPLGVYGFAGLVSGDYRVEVTAPDGLVFAPRGQGPDEIDSDVDAAGSARVTLGIGEVNPNIDAGLVAPDPMTGVIGDRVWLDADGDGVQDPGEAGLAGVAVALLAGGVAVATTTTDADGLYRFEGLAAGAYDVAITAPEGYAFTASNAPAATDATDSDVPLASVEGQTGRIAGIDLGRGATDLSNDAGLVRVAESAIGDRVWIDTDRDGLQDAGERGAAGVELELFRKDASGAFVATGLGTTTDADGLYAFEGLTDGTYQLRLAAPTGFSVTLAGQGADRAADSDVDATGVSGEIVLGIRETRTDIDAGLVTDRIALSGAIETRAVETQAIAVIIDVSSEAANTQGFGNLDGNGSGAVGTEVDAALASLADLAVKLTGEGRGDQEIVVFTNARDDGGPSRARVIETDTTGQPLTAAAIAAAAGDLGASGLFAQVFDSPAEFADTISVGEALADAAAWLGAQGKDTNQTILLTASTGYSDTLNANIAALGDGVGDSVVPGRLGIVAEPGDPLSPEFGAITTGLFEFRVSGATDNVVEIDGRKLGVKLEGAFFHREPVDLSAVIDAAAAPGQTLEIGTVFADGTGTVVDADTGAVVFPEVDFNQLALNQRGIFQVPYFDQSAGIIKIVTADYGPEVFLLDPRVDPAAVPASLTADGSPIRQVDPVLLYDPGDGANPATAFLFDPTDYPSLTSQTVDPALLDAAVPVTEVLLPGESGTDQFAIAGVATDLDIVFVDSLDNNQDIVIVEAGLFFEKGAVLDELQPDGVRVFDMAPFGLREIIADGDPEVTEGGAPVSFDVAALDAEGAELASELDALGLGDLSATATGFELAEVTVEAPAEAVTIALEIGIDTDGDGAADRVIAESFDLTQGGEQFAFEESLFA